MSRRYSSWRSLSSPNKRSSSTSEKPITALSGVRSSCDMLARNSDLCRPATSSWRDLLLELPEHAGVVDGDRRLAGERLEQLGGALGEGTGDPAAHEQRADDLLLPAQRHDEHRSPAGAREPLDVRIARLLREIRRALGLPARSGTPDEGLVEMDARRAQGGDELGLGAEAGADLEQLRLLVELEDRAALGAGELHGAGHDRRQHLVEVEARGHGLADLAERAQLVDGPGHVVEELHVADRDRRLRRERGQELDRAVAERLDVHAPERQDAGDAIVGEHRHAQDRPEPGELAPGVPAVVGVGEHVGDLDHAAAEPDPPDERSGVHLDRMARHVVPVGGRSADQVREPVAIAVEAVHEPGVGVAQAHRVADDGLEHRLEREVRVPHQLQDLARRRLLVPRFGQFAFQPSDMVGIRRHRVRSGGHREMLHR